MKFICVKDSYTDYGVFKNTIVKHIGLSLNKEYIGQIVAISGHSYLIIRVVIFNDLNQWSRYDIDLFVPAETQL